MACLLHTTKGKAFMCEYLQRRSARYYLRRRIPQDLISVYGKAVVQLSLGTSDPVFARKLCRRMSVALDTEWDSVRSGHTKTASFTAILDACQPNLSLPMATPETPCGGAVLSSKLKLLKVAAPSTSTTNVSMRAVLQAWANERKPASRTIHRTTQILGDFERLVGVLDVESVNKSHILKLKDAWLAAGQTAANINVKIAMLGVIFNYACDNALIGVNPASRVRIIEHRRAIEKRLNFNEAQLHQIFSGPVHKDGVRPSRGGGEAAYWLPLLGLYTGARLNELGQLRPSDVYKERYFDPSGAENEAWVLRIVSDELSGFEVKTASSVRRIPLHDELIALGFVDFIEQSKGRARVFSDVRLDAEGKITNTWRSIVA